MSDVLQHSILAPSSAKSWTNCTASISFARDNAHRIPPDTGSVYARMGTQAHEYAQMILEGKMEEKDLPSGFEKVTEYTDICKNLINRWGGSVFIEAKVSLFYLPSQNGTCDFGLLCDQCLQIRDLKWGEGVPVSAENNEQLASYAQSFVNELAMLYDLRDDLKVEIGIVQPRYPGEEGIEKIWTTTIKDLREFCGPIQAAAHAILENLKDPSSGEMVFAPSVSNCRWCKCVSFCKASAAQAFEPISSTVNLSVLDEFDTDEPESVQLPVVSALTDAQIVSIVRRGKELAAVVSSCEDYLTNRALTGDPAPGTKLVAGRQGNRAWTDEREAAEYLANDLGMKEQDVFDLKVKSPAKIEKALKADKDMKAAINALTTRSPGRPALTFSDDPRPAIEPPTEGFDVIEDSND